MSRAQGRPGQAAAHVGVDQPGRHDVDADAVAALLLGQREGEGLEGGLGHGVGSAVGPAIEPTSAA